MNTINTPSRPITLDELLVNDLHLVTYEPRYSDSNVGLFIAGNVEELAMMAEAMTDSGDYCDHILHMVQYTPYFPWGEGDNFAEALALALQAVNRIPREMWIKYAFTEVLTAPSRYPEIRENYVFWDPLPSINNLMKIPDEERPSRRFREIPNANKGNFAVRL